MILGSFARSKNWFIEYKAQGRYEKAERQHKRSLAIWEKTLGEDHPSVANTLNNLAVLYDAQGKGSIRKLCIRRFGF